ncbi:helix-turn-helix domain-containing protein [Halorubrum sp. CBA1125]|uniref:IclR family transcriptional regulator n=1 Tax=Halorubrum sp. CBA1125 TaxID=2668072 RepID=UPI0012E7A033|nr:helix-turn-helix domain-containing protein [Halorubrum sp. CBA1125]MUW13684.1 helix-turn-helix domain-containing protein [Halorubrum sp. CBA1125]
MVYEANRRVETSVRTFAILEHLGDGGQTGVSELATELDMNKGIVHNHLSTLRELGYVQKINENYQLTPKLLAVGFQARSNAPLYQFATNICSDFANQLDVSVVLVQQSTTECTIIDTHNIPESSDLTVGTTMPSGSSLVGLVVRVASPHEIETNAETGQYDIEQIRSEIEMDGYSSGPITAELPTKCVAIPIVDDDGECHGSVGVLLPNSHQEERLQRITDETVTLRERIENRFNSGWTGERSFTTEKHTWVG